ncbi:MAG: alpha/beta hydrolase [Pseudomonadota bacterium]
MIGPLDPELAAIVATLRASQTPAPFSGTPAQARERMRRAILAARERSPLPVVASIENRLAEADGASVPVRIYRPVGARRQRPTIVFFHGGGFVLGSAELMDDMACKLCRDIDAVVVSVDYRLAPENPFPAAHDDAMTATAWAVRKVSMLGGDPARIAVAGESAGGNLAASAALIARDRGWGISAQLLIVPGTDMARDTTVLEASNHDAPMLSPSDLRDIVRLYMGTNGAPLDAFPPSPMHAADFSGLPPAVIAVAGHDLLCGEGRAYAERLQAAGVPVRLHCFDDMFHPFFGFFAASASARRANDEICRSFAACLWDYPLSLSLAR